MNDYEHAQQIYTSMLAGWTSSGRPLPAAQEAKSWAEMAMQYAQAFREKNESKGETI